MVVLAPPGLLIKAEISGLFAGWWLMHVIRCFGKGWEMIMRAAGRGICRPLSAKGSAGASKPLESTRAQAAFVKAYSFGQRLLEANSVHAAATTLVD